MCVWGYLAKNGKVISHLFLFNHNFIVTSIRKQKKNVCVCVRVEKKGKIPHERRLIFLWDIWANIYFIRISATKAAVAATLKVVRWQQCIENIINGISR